ncbi:AraC-like ligand-binding domain-containing protein [Hamadaea tsunoensis]|uniref:AraC-like ligand-binding domain-containing protein n=1 Tax=Hamadaea tsunoensis TaxID=53368 RepID=UPI000429EB6E|nr:helix-turn-helix domain-containing protein [Hamadaea tsunoensis]
MATTWTTAVAPPGGRFAYWREVICEAFLDLSPESDRRDGFAGAVRQVGLGRLDLARIDSRRQLVRRTEADIEHAPRAGFYANLQVRGAGQAVQDGRSAYQRPGDLALVDTTRPFELIFPADFRQYSLFVPRELLPSGVRTAVRLDTTSGIGAAFRHILSALDRESAAPPHAARLAQHANGLLALLLDDAEPARPLRAPRTYAAAVADIEEHLTDEDLSPAGTARRLGCSVRTLHALFAGADRTYAATVRRLRLEYARRALADPARAHLRIIDIAADAGFADVSSFHRAFRREFGRSPGAVRNSSTGSVDPALRRSYRR